MKISLPSYMTDKMHVPLALTSDIYDGIEFFEEEVQDIDFRVCWGHPPINKVEKYAVAETGFFSNAAHLDTSGCYKNSSLNHNAKLIQDYSPPSNIIPQVLNSTFPSKYKQPSKTTYWGDVVFACQNPGDRSITSIAYAQDWWKFYEKCCKFYGKSLLVKLHPINKNQDLDKIKAIADRYKCTCGEFNVSCIKYCDHVVLFNSSFAVDCMLRGVRVKQGYPGYFHETGAVTFCDGDLYIKLEDTIDAGYNLVNFLAWKYCFSMNRDINGWKEIFRLYARSNDVFPLPESMSYASKLK